MNNEYLCLIIIASQNCMSCKYFVDNGLKDVMNYLYVKDINTIIVDIDGNERKKILNLINPNIYNVIFGTPMVILIPTKDVFTDKDVIPDIIFYRWVQIGPSDYIFIDRDIELEPFKKWIQNII